MNKKRWALLVSVAAVLVVAGAFIWTQLPIWQARRAVASVLVDPDAAIFRNVVVDGTTICGEMNAKNRMGAYGGFAMFAIDGDTVLLWPTEQKGGPEEGDTLSQLINKRSAAEDQLALMKRIQSLCGESLAAAGVVESAPPKRTDFEVRNYEGDESAVSTVLQRSGTGCVKLYTFRHKTSADVVLIQCYDVSGTDTHWIWKKSNKTAEGPIRNLPS